MKSEIKHESSLAPTIFNLVLDFVMGKVPHLIAGQIAKLVGYVDHLNIMVLSEPRRKGKWKVGESIFIGQKVQKEMNEAERSNGQTQFRRSRPLYLSTQ